MATEEFSLQQILHHQIQEILNVLYKESSEGQHDDLVYINNFLEECGSAFLRAESGKTPVPLKNTLTLNVRKYAIVKSFLLIKQTKLLMTSNRDYQNLISFKDNFILDFSTIVKQ